MTSAEGHIITTVAITPGQLEALRAAAMDRARREGGRINVSGVIRDVLDAWMAANSRKPSRKKHK